MIFSILHRWPRTTGAALAMQPRLAKLVRLSPVCFDVRFVAGLDVALSQDGRQVIGGAVVWDLVKREIVEQRIARCACRFPYVPGLLSFREAPAVLAAIRKLRTTPDVFLCDGQGYAHPRRIGLACHIGLWVNKPTIGCAKSRLCGEFDQPPPARGSCRPLRHAGEQIGVVLRTRDGVKPLFVSPGHLCDQASAVRITLQATTRFRLPEPARSAHQLVTRARLGF